ncbi:hypothetical protein [Geofilum rubicundum]|uniref:hypothetical protein n=1 Tax=Geofilum rubicundum TaxID=472113 RepID=UPI0021CDDA0B|nr:hypothetical protein [Geofilum rubicundum]
MDASPDGWTSWSGKKLVNALNPTHTTKVHEDGRVWLDSPPRSYSVYVLQEEFEPAKR